MKKVIIIGSGLGGLATALRLSVKGYKVTILEKHHQAGGRLNQLCKEGFSFDVGPSFFSMSYEFDELFNSCGVKNPLKYQELNPLYAVHFSHRQKPFLIYKDLKKLAREFENLEPSFYENATKYLGSAGQMFHDSVDTIVKKNFNSRVEYLGALTKVPLKHTPRIFRSMWSELNRHFKSEEVKVIFSLVSFFLGSTPFHTPAIYSLLNYTELQHDGYWNIKGGMYQIVKEMLKLLEEREVDIIYDTEIVAVEQKGNKVEALVDNDNRKWKADIYVCNSDAAAFRGQILNRKKFSEKKLRKME